MLPAAEGVGPRFDGVFVDRVFVESADAAPAIVIDMRHRRLMPVGFAKLPPFHRRGDDIVAVLENVRFHGEIVADDALDHVAPAVHERLQILDNGGGKSPRHWPSYNRYSLKSTS